MYIDSKAQQRPPMPDMSCALTGQCRQSSRATWISFTWFMRRHEMYTDYKAQRPPMPDAMKLAIPKIQQLLQVCFWGPFNDQQ